MKKTTVFLTLFLLAAIAELLAVSRGWTDVNLIAKPAVMLTLIGYYLSAAKARSGYMVRSMFFCWAGDLLLLKQAEEPTFFMLGLFSFMIGHLLYIYAYRRLQWSDMTNALVGLKKMLVGLPVFVSGVGLLLFLLPGLGGLTVPVIVYALVLVTMVMTALFRYNRTGADSFWLLSGGAFLFMISDSMLAINKFHAAFDLAGPLIMLTYMLAQFLIVEGALRHKNQDA